MHRATRSNSHGLSFAKPSKIGFFRIAAFSGTGLRRRQNPRQNLVAAASLEASMHSFVVRIALRQHVPSRTRVENPPHRFEHMPGRYRLTSRTSIGNMLLRKVFPNALPLLVRHPGAGSIPLYGSYFAPKRRREQRRRSNRLLFLTSRHC